MLEEILKYQEIEINISTAENELAKSPEREKAAEMQKVLRAGKSKVVEIENAAKKINDRFKKASDKYEQYTKKLEELEKELENADAEKIAVYEKAYKDFSAIANVLEKEIAAIYAEIKQINLDYETTAKKYTVDKTKFNKLKEDLAKQKKKVNEKLLKLYVQKIDNKIFPVFASLSTNKCSGCRMEISASKLGSMKNNEYGIIECENCGRYVYKK